MATLNNELIDNEIICSVCGSEQEKFFGIMKCNHKDFCIDCVYKLRTFYNDLKCSLCANVSENCAIYSIDNPISNYSKDVDEDCCYKDNCFFKNGIYYTETSSLEYILEKTNCKCPFKLCQEPVFPTLNQLILHVKYKHSVEYCEICIEQNKIYLSDAMLYKKTQLNNHKQYGEYNDHPSLTIPPHVQCNVSKNYLRFVILTFMT